ncbi:MAG: hypothetical protein IJR49_01830 [Treponema sp.]|nr:hypothetical protein [Treponema sp.]
MKVLEIRNILREDGAIYYLRKFRGEAVLDLPMGNLKSPITFSIETSPFGEKTIDVTIAKPLDYPVVPVKNALRTFILAEDEQGKLP